MHHLLAFSIGGTAAQPTYAIAFPGQIQTYSLQTLITFGLTMLVSVAILLSFIFVLIGGLKWILSQGDKKQLESAQKTILYAIIGLVVVLLSFFIVNLLQYFFTGRVGA